MMKAIQMTGFGPAEVLQYVDIPEPTPQAGEVVIRVESAAVNFMDVMLRRGDPVPQSVLLPYTPGLEVAGTIARAGEGVTHLPVGSRVLAAAGRDSDGGYAELAIASATNVIPMPAGVEMDVAAGLLASGLAATLLVTESAHLAPGETIFVPAAAGGVGTYVVQIAKAVGAATVIAGASTPEKRRIALELGADHAIDYREADWPAQVQQLTDGQGVDVALDMIGPSHLVQTAAALAPFGRLIEYGAAAGHVGHVDGAVLASMMYTNGHNQALINFNVSDYLLLRPDVAMQGVGRLLGWLSDGTVTGPTIHAMPLSEAARAHQLLESGTSVGKIILKP
jgi:NADPH2:quinone reductase